MPPLSRRSFLKATLAAGASVVISGTKSSGRAYGANERVRVAVAGLHSRGGAHIESYLKMKDVEIAWLIDPDTRQFGPRLKQIGDKGKPQTTQDIRTALADKELAAVSIATPNHWHALMTIWACEAGKDVYVEKPCSHNVHEGRIAVETARKHKRIVQHGTQGRGSSGWAQMAAVAKAGKLGKLLVSRGLCYKPRKSIGMKPNTDAPAEVDFNIWLGPAPQQPHHANLVHYNWHWFWDFGNGDIGNQGVHEMDRARWAIPGATLPKSAFCLGGRFGYTDQGQTPNTQIAVFDYGETLLVFEVRGLDTPDYYGQKVGNILHFEEGTVAGGKFWPKGKSDPQPLPKFDLPPEGKSRGEHFANFLACVRSRKPDDLNADIQEGHYSSALCHLANISYRLGEEVPFNAKTKSFGDNKEVAETLARMEEHLAKGNMLQLDGQKYRLGRTLTVDAAAERLVDCPEGNRLLTRQYRAPFAVPDKV